MNKSTEDALKNGSEEGSSSDDDDDFIKESFDGQSLSQEELKDMIEITCDDKILGDERFGPTYEGKPNFDYYIVKCPTNCDKGNTNVFGYNIHPEESSICKAAIIDNAMPLIGGVVGVGIGVGLEKYPSGEPRLGINVGEHQKSRKSFFVYKIDNIDFAAKNLRIVNHLGKPSHEGRVEIRVNGKWGSVCRKEI